MKSKIQLFICAVFLLNCNNLYTQEYNAELIMKPSGRLNFETIDINGDGHLDLSQFNVSGGLGGSDGYTVFLNSGDDKSFSHSEVLTFDVNLSNFESGFFEFSDIDNDGDCDLFYVGCSICSDYTGLGIFLNTDGTHFVYQEEIFNKNGGFTWPTMESVDMDNDGDNDLIMMETVGFDPGMYVFENTPSGFNRVDVFEDGESYTQLLTLDFNGDQREDIVVRSGSEVDVYIFDDFEFHDPIRFDLGHSNTLRSFDYNQDGVKDLYGTSQGILRVNFIENMQINESINYFIGDHTYVQYRPLDFDLDGDVDLVCGINNDSGILLMESDGTEFLEPRYISYAGFNINDIALLSQNNEEINLVFNNRSGTSGIINYSHETDTSIPHFFAIDPSKHRMVQISEDESYEILFWSGSWVGSIDYAQNSFPVVKTWRIETSGIIDLDLQDLDQDNDLDLLMIKNTGPSQNLDSTIVWYENVDGSYMNPTLLLADEFDITSIETFDFDNDGDLDIVAFSSFTSPRYYENDGQGTFEEESMPAGRSDDAIIVDINQDGYMDLLGWDKGGSIQYIENDGEGFFQSRIFMGSGDRAFYADALDVDGDNDLDIIGWFIEGENIRLFLNEEGVFVEMGLITSYFGEVVSYCEEGDCRLLGSHPLASISLNSSLDVFETVLNEDIEFENIRFADFTGSGKQDIIGYTSSVVGATSLRFIENFTIENPIVDEDDDGFDSQSDCDDFDPDINPAALELCNGIDDNCDGLIDEGIQQFSFYLDNDLDGYGGQTSELGCMPSPGYVDNSNDCDDENANIYPGAFDIPNNGIDEDCDGADTIEEEYIPFTIAQVKEVDVNGFPVHISEKVEIQGIVHSEDFRESIVIFNIIDDNRDGLTIFNPIDFDTYVPELGQKIKIRGEIIFFNGLSQVRPDEIIILNENNSLHEPREVTSLDEGTEGDLVLLRNVTVIDPSEWIGDGSNFSVSVSDGTDVSIIRIWEETFWADMTVPQGAFDIIGIGGQFDTSSPYFDGYQLQPRFENDIFITSSTSNDEFATEVLLSPNPVDRILSINTSEVLTELSIVNIAGKIQELKYELDPNKVDVSHLVDGIYFIIIQNEQGKTFKSKFVIMHNE